MPLHMHACLRQAGEARVVFLDFGWAKFTEDADLRAQDRKDLDAVVGPRGPPQETGLVAGRCL